MFSSNTGKFLNPNIRTRGRIEAQRSIGPETYNVTYGESNDKYP